MEQLKSQYPSTYYRVSLKAIIRNEAGRVLCVREDGSTAWNLPGGGLDHGETDFQGMARELYEEALIKDSFSMVPIGTEVRYLQKKLAYLLWIVFDVTFERLPDYGVGQDADEVTFIDPRTLKDSQYVPERLIYKWTVDRSYDARVED